MSVSTIDCASLKSKPSITGQIHIWFKGGKIAVIVSTRLPQSIASCVKNETSCDPTLVLNTHSIGRSKSQVKLNQSLVVINNGAKTFLWQYPSLSSCLKHYNEKDSWIISQSKSAIVMKLPYSLLSKNSFNLRAREKFNICVLLWQQELFTE